MKGKKTKKFMNGGMPTSPAGAMPPQAGAMPPQAGGAGAPDPRAILQEAMKDPKKAAVIKQAMQAKAASGGAGGMPPRAPGMKKGGKVRGCGIAKKGVRKAKMR